MKYAFFPGCTIADRLPFIEKSIRLVCPEYDIGLVGLPFTCCPEPNSVQSFSQYTWLTMAARNIAVAEEHDLDILTACAGCFESLAMAKHMLDTSADTRAHVNRALANIGREYTGQARVVHLLQVLHDDVGCKGIEERTLRQLRMRVVTHSGCHLLRPERVLQVDLAEAPAKLDALVRALGMESVDYMDKTMCCGAGIRGVNRDISFAVLREKFAGMSMVHPDAAVVFCPTCFISFEAGQRVVNRMFGTEYRLPVFYYTELLAVAMGLEGTESILSGHRVQGTEETVARAMGHGGTPAQAPMGTHGAREV